MEHIPRAPRNTPTQTESKISQSFVALGSFAMGMPFSSSPLSLGSMSSSSDIGLGVGWSRGLVSDGGDVPDEFGALAMSAEAIIVFVLPS